MKFPRIGGGTALAIAAFALFLLFYFPVLTGQRVLLGGDVLYQFLPWAGEPGAHAPANNIVFDPMLQVLPWQQLVQDDVAHGRLPLWNPTAQGGVPLLANDAAAAFSPFTWLALPFPAAIGLSLAMLAKLLVAGFGMAFYLRVLKVGGLAAAAGAVAYATSSFMVIWLQWPQSGVSAAMPWAFAGVEAFVQGERRWSLPLLSLAIAVQFLAGNAESSLHLGLGLGIYALVRWLMSGAKWQVVGGLALAAVIGTLVAGIQLVPFVDLLRSSALISVRSTAGMGFAHLHLSALTTWVFPNAAGNPGIDGGFGRFPNFSESAGFATVAMAVLSPLGAWGAWKGSRSVVVALMAIGVISAGIVYGVFTPVSGRLPLLTNADNARLTMVICFAVVALGALGFDTIARGEVWLHNRLLSLFTWLGCLALIGLVAAALEFARRGQVVDHLFQPIHGYIVFWLLTGLLSLGAAFGLAMGALFGGPRRVATVGLSTLVLLEATLFAAPFNPREPLSSVPPPSAAIAWLQSHAGNQSVTAVGTTLIPETATEYGMSDVRGYEILSDPRVRMYWSSADPGYSDALLYTVFDRPGAPWLAAAGVGYVMSAPADRAIDGTYVTYGGNGVVISQVPNPRPFAYSADSVASASGASDALADLKQAPMGPVVVEGCCPMAGHADVMVTKRVAGETDLIVNAQSASTIVVEQSFQPGWKATIDGHPVTIQPADLLFQSVQVPSGRHEIKLVYLPTSVIAGVASSVIGTLAIVLMALVGLLAKRQALTG